MHSDFILEVTRAIEMRTAMHPPLCRQPALSHSGNSLLLTYGRSLGRLFERNWKMGIAICLKLSSIRNSYVDWSAARFYKLRISLVIWKRNYLVQLVWQNFGFPNLTFTQTGLKMKLLIFRDFQKTGLVWWNSFSLIMWWVGAGCTTSL